MKNQKQNQKKFQRDSAKKKNIKLASKIAPHLLHLAVMIGCFDIAGMLLDVGFDSC
jgi:spore maturation protein SpmB